VAGRDLARRGDRREREVTRMARVLVVDDEASIRESLEMIVSYEGHEVETAQDGKECLEKLRDEEVDLVLLDVRMPGIDGLRVLQEIRKTRPDLQVVMISGQATIDAAMTAARAGAFDFIEKPLDRERLLLTVRNAVKQAELARENRELEGQIDRRYEILGESPEVRRILETIDRVAPTDARVLITGENGTGKEHVARRIHWRSRRRKAPFVDVNCAAIPPELIESELFGHEKGSFTGATGMKRGTFELADGGTLFLDEIGDMSPDAQAKVLRVLEEGRIQRVGGTTTLGIDVRVIAATNKDLLSEARENRFREDLYYRLNVVPIHIAPLRERQVDVPVLARHFLTESCRNHQVPTRVLTEGAIGFLRGYSWPGNIRELRNLMERLVILSSDEEVTEKVLREFLHRTHGDREDLFTQCETFEEFKERSERLFLEKKLVALGWNIKKTAESLGMQRSNLYKKLEKYGLK
jgi:DNA-binding NtrC family response regulator